MEKCWRRREKEENWRRATWRRRKEGEKSYLKEEEGGRLNEGKVRKVEKKKLAYKNRARYPPPVPCPHSPVTNVWVCSSVVGSFKRSNWAISSSSGMSMGVFSHSYWITSSVLASEVPGEEGNRKRISIGYVVSLKRPFSFILFFLFSQSSVLYVGPFFFLRGHLFLFFLVFCSFISTNISSLFFSFLSIFCFLCYN